LMIATVSLVELSRLGLARRLEAVGGDLPDFHQKSKAWVLSIVDFKRPFYFSDFPIHMSSSKLPE